MAFRKSANSFMTRTDEYVNEAYSAFPEEDQERGYKISETDDSDDVTSDESISEESKLVNEYPATSQVSDEKVHIERQKSKRKSSKRLRTTNKWDVFRETSADNVSSTDLHFWDTIFRLTKVVFTFLLFLLVLGSAVLSKSTLLLLVANIFSPNDLKNLTLETSNKSSFYQSSVLEVTYIWALVLVVIAPYVFTIASSVWKLVFKKTRPLEIKPLIVAMLVETIHSVALIFFIFVLLPNMDPVAGCLFCMNIAVVPNILTLIFSTRDCTARTIIQSFVGLAASVGSLACWVYYLDAKWLKYKSNLLAFSVAFPLLVSLYWWENFVPQGDEHSGRLSTLKRQLRSRRTKVSAIVCSWKIVVTISTVLSIYAGNCKDGIKCLQTLFDIHSDASFSSEYFMQMGFSEQFGKKTCSRFLPLYIAAVNIAASMFCYRCCVSANKILSQIPSFSLPIALSTPVTVALIIGVLSQKEIKLADYFSRDVHMTVVNVTRANHTYTDHTEVTHTDVTTSCLITFPGSTQSKVIDPFMITASLLGYISVLIVSLHIWRPTKERMQKENRMFVKPLYCGIFFDQSMVLNKRKYEDDSKGLDEKVAEVELPIPDNLEEWQSGQDDRSPLRTNETPFIYLCATMWHETENEMIQILKSLLRMDEDQCTRRNFQLFFGMRDPDYYEFEAHIFFDDAFDYNGDEATANGYVKQLIRTVNTAVSSVYAFGMKIPPPTKIDTPYGGRLVWRLPGGNKMIAHLKDKAMIRHRKRWSQVMYMYYFLAHKLLSVKGGKHKIKTRADNTFILALDGDVDFQPSALKLLVDRMKRNPNVGAACGRIHPIGSGPMVWYQKFEYAVSHWLQKATEHVIGCVLCSPGCFSLFRGSSLMDDNVMRRYTTPPSEARHYVQYDQGEDRWLCTLLLQQGYRVEYCAASDALTYAPEGFYEFYNQRRRWTPSTMANILDLLLDFKNVTKRNNDISMLYIAYQMLLMVSSILTPGTILLMVLAAINMAYPQLTLYWALFLNIVPVAIFIILCFVAKNNIQLAYAAVLSTIYSLVMMLVIVGLLKQAVENGFCSVTTIFLCFVAGVFVLAAFIHPQEFWCIPHGFLYFLAIPSMSMLLMLYSIGNLHVVSWGTRETPKPAAVPRPAEMRKPPEKKGAIQEWLEKIGLAEKAGTSDYMFSFGNLFRCICCPQEIKDSKTMQLNAILDRLDEIEAKLIEPSDSRMNEEQQASEQHVQFSEAADLFEGTTERTNPLFKEPTSPRLPNKPSTRHWIMDQELLDGDVETIREEETVFWKELIQTYLYPIEGDKKAQEKTQAELKELRNTVCLFFLLVNALFVVIVFTLQQVNADSGGTISIKLPCSNGKPGDSIEPISMAFTVIFGILLVIQCLCMLLHRMTTFLQICSITEIKRPKQLELKEQKLTVENGLQLVRDMQGIKEDEDRKSVVSEDMSVIKESRGADDDDTVNALEEKRKEYLWKKLAHRRKEQQFGTLSQNFVKNFKKLQRHMEDQEDASTTDSPRRGFSGLMRSFSKDPEEGDIHGNLQQQTTLQRKFKRLERGSISTIVKMSRDPRFKQSVLRRGGEVASRWQRAARKARQLKSDSEQGAKNTGEDMTDFQNSNKANFVDNAKLTDSPTYNNVNL